MTTDDAGTPEEPSSLSGDVVPDGPGEWLTLEEAAARLGIDRKAVYRRIRRGRMTGKKAPFASHLLVWFPLGPSDETHPEGEEQRSLSVPAAQDQFLAMLDRATASLGQQIERLAVERDEARNALEQRSQEHERELQQEQERAAHAEALAAERGRELDRERARSIWKPWTWRWW